MRTFLGFSDPALPSSYALALVELLVERGHAETRTLLGSNLTLAMLRNPQTRVSFEQLLRLIRNAFELTGVHSLGLEFGSRLRVTSLGTVGLAIMSQADLRGAVAIAEKYHRVLVPHATLRARVQGELAILHVEHEIPLGAFKPFVTEALLACLTNVATFLLGRPLAEASIAVDYPDPGYAALYRQVLGCEVHFDAPAVELRLPRGALDAKLPLGCEPTARLAEELCERELAPLLGQDAVVHKVRSLLLVDGARFATVPELARALRTSERSLRRALQAHGTSYQELRDQVRLKLALHQLNSSGAPIDEVARKLGFSSGRSFRRALKRWTGKSPSDLREG